MNTTEKLSELNTKALEIAEKYPNDYHNRKDYREIIDKKPVLITGKIITLQN
jgi:hypothetical protein